MAETQFDRERMLLGDEAMQVLAASHVAVFGVGGVGSFAAEALARAGVGAITLVDHDTVSLTNLNRQLIALHSTIGMRKTDVMASRILDINPACRVTNLPVFYEPECREDFFSRGFDYIADCIDSTRSKLDLIETAITRGEFCKLIAGYIEAKTGKTIAEYCRVQKAETAEFDDVKNSEDHILGIASLGIITGFPDNTFRPDALITRQDAAIILARLAAAMGAAVETGSLQFSDAADISDYAKPGVAYAASLGIMNGNANGSFAPRRMITREQAVVTVMNAWRKLS